MLVILVAMGVPLLAWVVVVIVIHVIRADHERVGGWRHAGDTGSRPCSLCGYDLRASEDRCPECGCTRTDRLLAKGHKLDPQLLQDDWPESDAEIRELEPGEKLAIVHQAELSFEANLVTQQLRARGIDAMQRNEALPSLSSFGLPASVSCVVMVPSNDRVREEALIDAWRPKPSVSAVSGDHPSETERR